MVDPFLPDYREHVSALPILATKLYRPPVNPDFEPRATILERLNRNKLRPLTLISAPAGYGKSTLASMWLEAAGCPSAWVSLDEGDNDLITFLSHLVAAVQRAFPDVELRTRALLQAPAIPLVSVAARQLLNDLERIEEHFILALDDVYMIHDQLIFDLLSELLRHPSPTMHLLLITRRDPPIPMASLRAHRQITEIRSHDLRFSISDTASLLTKMLRREIDEATAAVWTERTEGWVTALCLAAISLRQHDQRGTTPDAMPANSHYLQEYLLEEVIDRLDTTLKEWLLAIAWLDRFCPELCTAVYQPDSPAAKADVTGMEFIRQLRRDNLFIIPLDSENRWFRLHHLFRSLLQDWGRGHYQDDEIAEFYRRAGDWFAHEDVPDEAIPYLVLAGDIAGAEQVVLQHRYTLMNAEQWSRLERWLDYFPEDAQESSALLTSTIAVLALHSRNRQRMGPSLERAHQLLANQTPNSIVGCDNVVGEISVVMSVQAIGAGDAEAVTTNAQRALQLLPAEALDLRAIAWGGLAAGMQMSGRYPSAYQLLHETINSRQWPRSIQAKLMTYSCMISFMQGDLTASLECADRARSVSEELHLPEAMSHARHFLGVIHYLRCEFDAAEPHLAALVKDLAMSSPTFSALGGFALALIHNERGDIEQADALMDQVSAHFRQTGDSAALALLQAGAVELALRQGDLGAARRRQIGVEFNHRPPLWFFYVPQLTSVKLLLAQGTPEALAAARATLDEFEQRMRSVHRNVAHIDALALLALVCDAQGDTACADASLTTALALAQNAGLIRPFVDLGPPMVDLLVRLRSQKKSLSAPVLSHVARILAAFPPPDSAVPPVDQLPDDTRSSRVTQGMHEPLTNRESQVLRLLATELSPNEMGRMLSLSTSTVRTHIRNIYAKLVVHTRSEAVHRASELGLL